MREEKKGSRIEFSAQKVKVNTRVRLDERQRRMVTQEEEARRNVQEVVRGQRILERQHQIIEQVLSPDGSGDT